MIRKIKKNCLSLSLTIFFLIPCTLFAETLVYKIASGIPNNGATGKAYLPGGIKRGEVVVGDPVLDIPTRGWIQFERYDNLFHENPKAIELVEEIFLYVYVTEPADKNSSFYVKDLYKLLHPTLKQHRAIISEEYDGTAIWLGIDKGAHIGGFEGPVDKGWYQIGLKPSLFEHNYPNQYIAIGLHEVGDDSDEFVFDGDGSEHEPYLEVHITTPHWNNADVQDAISGINIEKVEEGDPGIGTGEDYDGNYTLYWSFSGANSEPANWHWEVLEDDNKEFKSPQIYALYDSELEYTSSLLKFTTRNKSSGLYYYKCRAAAYKGGEAYSGNDTWGNTIAHVYVLYKISGYVKTADGKGIEGVQMTFSGTGDDISAQTNASGYYELRRFPYGIFEITPSKNGYTFEPDSRTVEISGSDQSNINFIKKAATPVAGTGIITTVTGTEGWGYCSGDGGKATEAKLAGPNDVFVDSEGNLFIADTANDRIRRVDGKTGIITTVAGTGCYTPPPALHAPPLLDNIRRVDGQTDIITTAPGIVSGRDLGDGGKAIEAELADPYDVFVDSEGHLFIAASSNHRIRRVDGKTGIITTVAGTGEEGSSGDGGKATEAKLAWPYDVFIDSEGHLFIAASSNHRIRRVDGKTGIITTVAGTGEHGFSGDGGKATEARIYRPSGVFVDSEGNLFIADLANERIRRVDGKTGIITTVAGTGEHGFSGDGGKATEAKLAWPFDVFVDSEGHLFIAASSNHRIRRVDGKTGIITTVAGTGEEGFSGDGGKATEARIRNPSGVFVDSEGNLFIADTANDRIRRVEGIAAPTTLKVGVFAPGETPSEVPVVEYLNPTIGVVGSTVSITGENFGDSQGASTVTFNDVDAGAAINWTSEQIQVKVPVGATTGAVVVTIGGKESNKDKMFTVTNPNVHLTIESNIHHLGDNRNEEWDVPDPEGLSFKGSFKLSDLNFENPYLSIEVFGLDIAKRPVTINSIEIGRITGPTGDYWHTETLAVDKGALKRGTNTIVISTSHSEREGGSDDIQFRNLTLHWNASGTEPTAQIQIWPGDTNNDGIVNAIDVLPLGAYLNHTGEPRQDASIEWKAQYATLWEPEAATYADANGDGRVTIGVDADGDGRIVGIELGDDIKVIEQNWHKTHEVLPPASPVKDYLDIDHSRYIAAYEKLLRTLEKRPQSEANLEMIAVLQKAIQKGAKQEAIPQFTRLLQNYPNPFNPETWIPYELSEPADVSINIYNASGQLVRTIKSGRKMAGIYSTKNRAAYWDGRNKSGDKVANGVYFYTLEAGDFKATKKLLILK